MSSPLDLVSEAGILLAGGPVSFKLLHTHTHPPSVSCLLGVPCPSLTHPSSLSVLLTGDPVSFTHTPILPQCVWAGAQPGTDEEESERIWRAVAASCLGPSPTLTTTAPDHLQVLVSSVPGGYGEMGVLNIILAETWLWLSSLRGKGSQFWA